MKRRIYLDEAVDEHWIVDVDARCVERRRCGDGRPEGVDSALVIVVLGLIGEAIAW